jgi:hypothetical protein
MAAGGRTENSDGPEADNVIRFPRNWFGSKDDLVPFGPAADRLEAADTEQLHEADLSDALNANNFWGEGAGALHQPVDVPDTPTPRVPERVGRGEPTMRAVPAFAPAPEPDAGMIRGFEAGDLPPQIGSAPIPVSARRRPEARRGWLSGLAVAALLICAVGVFIVSRPHASPTTRQAQAHLQLGVTPGVAVSAVADRLAVSSLGEASQATLAAQQAARRRALTAERRSAEAKRRSTEAKRAAAARRAEAARHKTVKKTHARRSTSSSTAHTTSGSDTPDSADASTAPPAAASPPVSEPAETSSVSPTSSSLAPGPTTAGSAGPNCDPQCQ